MINWVSIVTGENA